MGYPIEIESESLVYYAARNPKTGEYKKAREYGGGVGYDLGKVKLYHSKTTAETYGRKAGCTEIVKMKVVRIK